MPEGWNLSEIRLVQNRAAVSAANALFLMIGGGVPAGKLWVITAFAYFPSVNETQIIGIGKYNGNNAVEYPVLNPVSLVLVPHYATFLEQGQEFILFPSEQIIVRRGGATAGSTMNANLQFIETDLPLYEYIEPQEVKRIGQLRSSIMRRVGGGAVAGSPRRERPVRGKEERGGKLA